MMSNDVIKIQKLIKYTCNVVQNAKQRMDQSNQRVMAHAHEPVQWDTSAGVEARLYYSLDPRLPFLAIRYSRSWRDRQMLHVLGR